MGQKAGLGEHAAHFRLFLIPHWALLSVVNYTPASGYEIIAPEYLGVSSVCAAINTH